MRESFIPSGVFFFETTNCCQYKWLLRRLFSSQFSTLRHLLDSVFTQQQAFNGISCFLPQESVFFSKDKLRQRGPYPDRLWIFGRGHSTLVKINGSTLDAGARSSAPNPLLFIARTIKLAAPCPSAGRVQDDRTRRSPEEKKGGSQNTRHTVSPRLFSAQ